jgi:hypothetical protein
VELRSVLVKPELHDVEQQLLGALNAAHRNLRAAIGSETEHRMALGAYRIALQRFTDFLLRGTVPED